jgi:hypothetical protein
MEMSIIINVPQRYLLHSNTITLCLDQCENICKKNYVVMLKKKHARLKFEFVNAFKRRKFS